MLQGSQGNSTVITDTTCFILLDKIDALPILHALYSNVITTPQIAGEFGKPLPYWINVVDVLNKELQSVYEQKVDIGEASAIALAMEIDSPLLILDDLKGRKLAAELKLTFTGTLGVLVLAKQSNIIPLLKPYFTKIKATNFRISPSLLDEVLKEIGE